MVSPIGEVARFLGFRLFLADFGEAGGDTLLWDSEDLPEDTAESLSESSDFTAVLLVLLWFRVTVLWLLLLFLFPVPVEAGTSLEEDFSVLTTEVELLEEGEVLYSVNGFLL